jgi:recombination associated protein RdgC
MWFKNILIYRFSKPFSLSAEELENKLAEAPALPCGPQEQFRQGWSAPLGRNGQQLVHVTGPYWMITLCKEERLLPSTVVKEALDEKVQAIEDEQARKVRKKEKDELKEEIITDLLPRAFKRSSYTYAYIDTRNNWLIVNASSGKKADDLTSFLRKTLGSLPVKFPEVNSSPAAMMTAWVEGTDTVPGEFVINDECELQSQSQEKSVVRCRGVDMAGDELQTHIKADKQVVKLALSWQERMSFIFNEDLSIKRIKFGEFVEEKMGDMNPESAAERFDASFSIMAAEFAEFIPQILNAFGGEDESKLVAA